MKGQLSIHPMKVFLFILIVVGLGFIGYQVKDQFGEPIMDALSSEDEAVKEDYQARLAQLRGQVFGPLSGSDSSIRTDALLRKLDEDLRAGTISRKEDARIRRSVSALQPAIQERNRFVSEYQSLKSSNKKSFDPGVQERKLKLLQQDLERRWKETSQRLEAAYNRQS